MHEVTLYDETHVRGEYRNINFEIVQWRDADWRVDIMKGIGDGAQTCWNYYIDVPLRKLTDALRATILQAPGVDAVFPEHMNFQDDALAENLAMHGGCTYRELKFRHFTTSPIYRLGCDYMHADDMLNPDKPTQASVLEDVKMTIDDLYENFIQSDADKT